MRNSLIKCLGLATAIVVTVPINVQAQIFDYDRLEFLETRPLSANGTLFFFGDQNQNEGFATMQQVENIAQIPQELLVQQLLKV